jgi:hypothetical protein
VKYSFEFPLKTDAAEEVVFGSLKVQTKVESEKFHQLCVCVCEREREREREFYKKFLDILG